MNFLQLETPPGVPHIPIKLLKMIGIIGRQMDRFRIVPLFLVYIFIIAIPKSFYGYPNFEVTIIGIAELFFQTNTFCGIFLLFINGYKLEQLIARAKAFSQTVLRETSPAIVQHLNTQHKLIHKVTRIFFIVVTYAAHFYVFAPILSTLFTLYGTNRDVNETMHYTLHMEENFYGLPTRTSGPHYLLFSAIMTPTSYLCAFAGTVKIIAICNFIIYCTLYFQLVQIKLQTVAQENAFHQQLKAIVKMHQDALHCAKMLESITSLVLLQQLLLCVLIWCSMLLYFTVSGFNVNFMSLVVLFVFDTTETFAYCYLGERLSNESAQVAHVAYECFRETQTTAIQKDLMLVLVRAQTPVGITAGKFCYMNMEQFGIILKTTYSFFVVLREQF
ncbi:odorant receptor 49b-like [Anopheles maculipalpis]|uniref:odorant receptor 49b-like n=1 Tax=Anopheles maculipalpis TaxID=1496333 RepID=UPI0021596747|nr:odorant receptor 49b-like [Anopheles maculipalpis]